MAGGFGLDDSGDVVLQQDAASVGGSAGVTSGVGGTSGITLGGAATQTDPGSIQQLQGIANENTNTGPLLDSVAKLTGGAIDKYISNIQTKEYYNGMAQVVQGKALQSIEDEQPWYTKIFGPNASVRGAQAMTVSSAVTDSQTQFMNDLPDLAKQSPDDVRKYLVNQAAAVNVGDPDVNNVIQAKLAEGWQPMLEMHMKKHYAYVQKTSLDSFTKSQVSTGSNLQTIAQQAQGGFLSDDTSRTIAKQTLDQIDSGKGLMDDETWNKANVQSYLANMQNGNYAYGTVFKKSQAYAALPIETREKLDTQGIAFENKGLKDLMTNDTSFGQAKAQLFSSVTAGHLLTNNEIRAQARTLNQSVAGSTGISQPFVTGQEIDHLTENNNAYISHQIDKGQNKADAAAQKQADVAAKAAAKDQDTNTGVAMAESGDPQRAITTKAMTANEVDLYTSGQVNTLLSSNPTAAANKLVSYNRLGYVSPTLANQLTQGIRGSIGTGYNDAFNASAGVYDTISKTPGGDAAVDKYYGDYAPQMRLYNQTVGSGAQPEQAWQVAFGPQGLKLDNLQDRARLEGVQPTAAISSAVDKYFSHGFAQLFGGPETAADYVKRGLTTTISSKVDKYVGPGMNMTIDQATQLASKNSDMDLMGEDGYVRRPGQQTMAQSLHIDDRAMGSVFSHVRDAKLAAIGLDKSNITSLLRLNGNNLTMFAIDHDGNTKIIPIHGDELESEYQTAALKKVRDNTKQPFNPLQGQVPGTSPADFTP